MDRDLVLSGRLTVKKEAEALLSFVDSIDDNFAKACEALFACRGTVVITGMGKSGLVARKWASTLASTGTPAYFLNPAEAQHGDMGILRAEDVLVALSFSGETEELRPVLRHALDLGISSVGVTGEAASSLAKSVSILLSVALNEEACPLGLAPTTSTTVMMALGDALAITLMQMRGFSEKDFARLHPGGSLGRRLWLRVTELMHQGDAIPFVTSTDTLDAVLLEMTRKRLGLAVVRDDDGVKGIITDGDLRRHFQKSGMDKKTTALQMMTPSPKKIPATALAVEAREIMEKNKIQHLLIESEGGDLLGVIHLHDLLRAKVV